MKKLVLTLLVFVFLFTAQAVKADLYAISSKSIKYYGVGVLNVPKNIKVYKSPDKNSEVILDINYDKLKKSAIRFSTKTQKISYVTYIPSSGIALLTVDTDNENGWYKVYINQKTGETGWVFIEDDNAFDTYKSLFYKYGKKYGINMFSDIPKDIKVLYAKQSLDSQKLEQLTYPKYINFTVISGNWMLVKVSDMSKHAKVGWFNWRNDDGTLNMFPNFK